MGSFIDSFFYFSIYIETNYELFHLFSNEHVLAK